MMSSIILRKAKSFPLWLTRKINAYALENMRNALNVAIDITQVPKARGNLRHVQIIDTKLLQVLDGFLKRIGCRYMMSYGTLLGAVRHGGFIPWDDDIDLMVFVDDYLPMLDKLGHELTGSHFRMYGLDACRGDDATAKITYADFPSSNIDFFCMVPSSLSYAELCCKRVALKKLAREKMSDSWNLTIRHASAQELSGYWRRFVSDVSTIVSKCDVDAAKSFFGIGCLDANCYQREDILPLRTVQFEGCEFMAPNNPTNYLDETLGDWMSFPSRFDHHGGMFLNFTEDDARDAKDFLDLCIAKNKFL